MDGTCNTHGRDNKCVHNFFFEKGNDHMDDLSIDGSG
jgi:hypothetical protein